MVVTDKIPVFPLDHVLLPGLPLPLHIFEPRYRQMLADIDTRPSTFGVVALHRGGETSADVDFADVGTLAEILEKEPYPDGSCDLLTIGSRRFRVVEVDRSSKPYLQARVEWLTEDDGELSADLVPVATALFGRYSHVLAELSSRDRDTELADDPLRLSYEIAARVQLPVAQRQRLLAMSTAAERLAACLVVMRREITLIEQTRSIPVATQALRILPGSN
jgi:Lon protease-like protein